MTTPSRHPMQEIVIAPDGVVRFRPNKIIRYLQATGKIDLNEIGRLAAAGLVDADDEMQLAQLLGYSVNGFGELSYATEDVVELADARAAALPGMLAKTGSDPAEDPRVEALAARLWFDNLDQIGWPNGGLTWAAMGAPGVAGTTDDERPRFRSYARTAIRTLAEESTA